MAGGGTAAAEPPQQQQQQQGGLMLLAGADAWCVLLASMSGAAARWCAHAEHAASCGARWPRTGQHAAVRTRALRRRCAGATLVWHRHRRAPLQAAAGRGARTAPVMHAGGAHGQSRARADRPACATRSCDGARRPCPIPHATCRRSCSPHRRLPPRHTSDRHSPPSPVRPHRLYSAAGRPCLHAPPLRSSTPASSLPIPSIPSPPPPHLAPASRRTRCLAQLPPTLSPR